MFLGWNTIDFDEDLIRQALYKTLHNPYLTNRDGNSRSDVMRMAQACSLTAPSALTFPLGDGGKKIFKLDRFAPSNGFSHEQAHDAMGDVEATIFLAKLLMVKAPEVWSSFMRFSTKAAVVDYINEERVFCFSDFYFGKPLSCAATVIGQNQGNAAEWYIYDLSVDPSSLLSLTESKLKARLNASPKVVRKLKSNGVPMLLPFEDAPDICKGRDQGLEELERRADLLRAGTEARERLVSAFESLKAEYPVSPHVEKQIYNGFFEPMDERLMDEFHEVEWSKRHAIVEKFQDQRLRTIGKRLIHLERPDLLEESARREHDLAVANRLLGRDPDVPWLTLPKALDEIRGILSTMARSESALLQEHYDHLHERHRLAVAHAN
jgi:exodeoxyribonuclease-1